MSDDRDIVPGDPARICDFTSLLLMIIDLHDSYRNTVINKVTDFSLTLLSR